MDQPAVSTNAACTLKENTNTRNQRKQGLLPCPGKTAPSVCLATVVAVLLSAHMPTLLALGLVISNTSILTHLVWLQRAQWCTKYSHILIIWALNVTLIFKIIAQHFAQHSGFWWCIIMPSVVEKDCVVEKILSGQWLIFLTFVETFELNTAIKYCYWTVCTLVYNDLPSNLVWLQRIRRYSTNN